MTVVKAPQHNRRPLAAFAGAFALTATSIGLWAATASTAQAAALPTPDHVVVVVMENHAYSQVIGSSSAPYINNTLK
ncbi:acid phosphatase, partial [Streptomyces sp. NPDC059468]